MKRDDKKALLALPEEQLRTKVRELGVDLLKARQERYVQDRSEVNVKRGFVLREQIKMIKSELRRRELAPAAQE